MIVVCPSPTHTHNTGGLGSNRNLEAVAALNLPSIVNPTIPTPATTPLAIRQVNPTPLSHREAVPTSHDRAPFIVVEALPVVPSRLVKKILCGDFTDMAKLLNDNIEAERQRMAAGDGSQYQD